MAFNPIVIEKGLTAGLAQKMAEFLAARGLAPGLMSAVLGISSSAAYEKMGWIGAMGAVQQWLGELSAKGWENYDYTIKNLDWVATAPVHENDLDDDQTGVLSLIPSLLAKRILVHPEKLVSALATGGTTGLAYDDVTFFSDATGARTIDNLLAGTGTTLAQMEADLNAALVAMAKFPDDQGEPLNIQGKLIYCPVGLERKFRRLVNSPTDPTGTVADTYNPYTDIQVISDARLDAADVNDWYLFATNEVVKPFVFSTRQTGRPMFEKKNLTKEWIYSVNYRGNAGYGVPHLAVKTVNS